MAKLNTIVAKKIKGYGIMEPIMATSILIFSITGFTILVKDIVSYANSMKKNEAYMIANEMLHKTKIDNTFIDEMFETEKFRIKKTTSAYIDSETLFELTVSVSDLNNEVVAELNEIIVVNK